MPCLLALAPASYLHAQTSLTTYHNDQARDGWNQNETVLTTANVNSANFGKLFSNAVDGQVYAQPLYMPNVSIGGGTHNVVYVVTENDSAYAFDADTAGVTYWHDSFIGGVTMTVAQADVGNCSQITPQIGITDTPVIDPSNGIMYFVAMTKTVSGGVTTFTQTLHALNITTGAETANGPQTIGASFPGTGDGGTTVTFRPRAYKERSALALVNGVVYTSWTGHCDSDTIAGNYYGWVIGYSASNITQRVSVYCSAPNGSESSFWESGDGPSVDTSGNLYYLAANGTFDQTAPVSDYGQCFIKLNTAGNALTVLDYFAPMTEASMSSADQDVGSAGQCLLPASWGTTAHPNIILGADKPSDLYVVDADTGSMGKFSSTANNIIQTVPAIGGRGYTTAAIYSNGVTNFVYWGMTGAPLKAFVFSNGQYVTPYSSATSETYSGSSSGCVPSVSSNGTTNGIVWGLLPGTPVLLCAYNATNLAEELYTSGQNSTRDTAVASYVKFAPPSVANGKVYVPTSSSLVVYGLLSTGATGTPPTGTAVPTASATSTVTRSQTPTATRSVTSSFTPTPTATFSSTRSPTSTATGTSTATPTSSPTASTTPTTTSSSTRSPTASRTATLTFTTTFTPTAAFSATPTAPPPTLTNTPTTSTTSVKTSTATPTSTNTPVNSSTVTPTPTFSSTHSPTGTDTGTSTAPPTVSSTASMTPTATSSSTDSPIATRTATSVFTPTTSSTTTSSSTPTAPPPTLTFTPTNSATPVKTSTATPTSTNTPVNSSTFTPTITTTFSFTPTPTGTVTGTSTVPPTSSPRPTIPPLTQTVTLTHSTTPQDTSTVTPITTNAPVNSSTFTSTPTGTSSGTPTTTSTVSSTASMTPTAISVNTTTPVPTSTNALVNTSTATPTSTLVALTVTPTFLLPDTFTPTPTTAPTLTLAPISTPLPTSSPTPTSTPTLAWTLTFTPRPTLPAGTATVPVAPANPALYPNPVSTGTTALLRVNLGSVSNVRIQVFTLSFRKVCDQTVDNLAPGIKTLPIPLVGNDGQPLSNGLYYVVVTVNGHRTVLKLLILR